MDKRFRTEPLLVEKAQRRKIMHLTESITVVLKRVMYEDWTGSGWGPVACFFSTQ
jgi:hypothetical protein